MKINLLPEQKGTNALDKDEIIKRLFYGVSSVLVFAAALFVVLTINLKFKQSKFTVLDYRHQNYVNLKNEIQKLKENIRFLNKENGLIKSSFTKKFFWSEKLLILSKCMLPELWLKTIRVDKENQMKLKGFLLPALTKERPIAILSNFIRRLQQNKEFFKDFSEISLVDIKSASTKGKEVYEFNIALIIKD